MVQNNASVSAMQAGWYILHTGIQNVRLLYTLGFQDIEISMSLKKFGNKKKYDQ